MKFSILGKLCSFSFLICLLTLIRPTYAMTIEEFGAKFNAGIKYFLDSSSGGAWRVISRLIEAQWVNLEYTVINDSKDVQYIVYSDRQPLFVNNFDHKWIYVVPETLVPADVMRRGKELVTKKKDDAQKGYVLTGHSIGTLQYYYHNWQTNITTVRFQVVTNTPVKSSRECVLKFHIKVKGPQLNSYLNVISDPENKRYERTCVPYIIEDEGALTADCGLIWCERPKNRDFAKINIVVIPPPVQMTRLTTPLCKKEQTSEFPKTVFIYPNSTDPKEKARTEERYELQPLQSICPGGTWTIKLPADFQFKKFEFGFTKPILGYQDAISHYKIEPDQAIIGWPTIGDIKYPGSCVYDAKNTCSTVLPASGTGGRGPPPAIKTPEKGSATITLTNASQHAHSIPTFSAWSVTPYRKYNAPPARRSSAFDHHIKK
jgi:hypothetical protein